MNVELELLVSRLRWPLSSPRWWAMQELSQLLRLPELREAVSTRLLDELRTCRLEAEVVEVLSVFWMAAARGYAPPPELSAAVGCPSILASLLLGEMRQRSTADFNPPLQVAPSDFDVPSDFLEVQGAPVPRVYLTMLEHLESRAPLPFVHQCAFEWSKNKQAYPDAPLQGDLAYFIRPAGEGMTGAFPSRATLRMLSAYQRTLAVAQKHWRVPDSVVQKFALDALPIDPTLAFLRPRRPTWLASLGQSVGTDAGSVETFIRQTVQSLEAERGGAMLLALVTPTFVSRDEFVELSVVRWRQWGTAAVDSKRLERHFRAQTAEGKYGSCSAAGLSVRTGLPVLPLEAVRDSESSAAPMAAVQGFVRLGYVQRDLYPERLYYPVLTGAHSNVVVEPMDDRVRISSDLGQMGSFHYWNAGWAPVHPTSIGALCGTALVGGTDRLQAREEEPATHHFYLWKAKRLKRPGGYGKFVEDELTGVLFV